MQLILETTLIVPDGVLGKTLMVPHSVKCYNFIRSLRSKELQEEEVCVWGGGFHVIPVPRMIAWNSAQSWLLQGRVILTLSAFGWDLVHFHAVA